MRALITGAASGIGRAVAFNLAEHGWDNETAALLLVDRDADGLEVVATALRALGATVITAALERSGVAPKEVDEVILGHVLQAAAGQGPARQAAIKAGVPAEAGEVRDPLEGADGIGDERLVRHPQHGRLRHRSQARLEVMQVIDPVAGAQLPRVPASAAHCTGVPP